MPFPRSLNRYRGCTQACDSCCARATHPRLGLNAGDDCFGVILVKANLPDELRAVLTRPLRLCESVGLGTATDPCQRRERRCRITTHRRLEVLRAVAAPASVVTRSTLVLRDRATLPRLSLRQ